MFTNSEQKSNASIINPVTEYIKTTHVEIKSLKEQLVTCKKTLEALELELKSSENQQAGTPNTLFSSRTSSAITTDITLNQNIQKHLTEDLAKKEKSLDELLTNDYIVDLNANIRVYPPQIPSEKSQPGTCLPAGDMHGNTLKLIYILVRHQFINMSKNEYDEIVSIYDTPIPKKENPNFEQDKKNYAIKIKRFREIIAACFERSDPNLVGKLLLLGDLIADRGQNDLFTILLMPYLIRRKGKEGFGIVEKFLSSNHDDIALVKLFNGIDIFPDDLIPFKLSLVNLEACIDMELVSKQEMIDILNEYYIPNLQALDYAEYEENGEQHVDVYCHAPCHVFKIVKEAARIYGITNEDYDFDDTLERFFEIVDKINKKFSDSGGIMATEYHVLFKLITNRGLSVPSEHINDDSHLPAIYDKRQMHYLHGHDRKKIEKTASKKQLIYNILTESALPHMRNFDNSFGMPLSYQMYYGTSMYFTRFLRGRQFKHNYKHEEPTLASSLKI